MSVAFIVDDEGQSLTLGPPAAPVDRVARSGGANYRKQKRVGKRAKRAFAGFTSPTITLSGRQYAVLEPASLDLTREWLRSGAPLAVSIAGVLEPGIYAVAEARFHNDQFLETVAQRAGWRIRLLRVE